MKKKILLIQKILPKVQLYKIKMLTIFKTKKNKIKHSQSICKQVTLKSEKKLHLNFHKIIYFVFIFNLLLILIIYNCL